MSALTKPKQSNRTVNRSVIPAQAGIHFGRKNGSPLSRGRHSVTDALLRSALREPADHESRAGADHHDALRLWLRLLTCTLLIEGKVRAGLRREFNTTLPRFDLLAQLERYPEGLKMGELSRRMMVTGGNVTGITDQLVGEGLVERVPLPNDRRALKVRLTRSGRKSFAAMARAHEAWIVELLAGLSQTDQRSAYRLLGKMKATIRQREETKP